MDEPDRVARQLLESAASLANAVNARAIFVSITGLPDLDAVPPRTILIARTDEDRVAAERLADTAHGRIDVPDVELDRMGQVKLAAIIGLSDGVIDLGDDVIFLSGPHGALIDTIVATKLGAEYGIFDTDEPSEMARSIQRAVFHQFMASDRDFIEGQNATGRSQQQADNCITAGNHRFLRVQFFLERQRNDQRHQQQRKENRHTDRRTVTGCDTGK